jgi:hypothetical protein
VNQTDLENSLSLKRDKTTLLTMTDMGQDVKTAMTGGSVAVVGTDSTDTVNIKDNAVIAEKTDFVIRSKQLYNPNLAVQQNKRMYSDGSIVADPTRFLTQALFFKAGTYIMQYNGTNYVLNYTALFTKAMTFVGMQTNSNYSGANINTNKTAITFTLPQDGMVIWDFTPRNSGSFTDFPTQFVVFKDAATLDLRYYSMTNPDLLKIMNDWHDKNFYSYGDSISAGSGGASTSWQTELIKSLGFANAYVRGIGGQTLSWNTNIWYANADGSYADRPPNAQPANTTVHKGAFCSWDRITTMIPQNADLIIIMGGTNDFGANIPLGDLSWSASNNTDSEWVNATGYYNGGDFNINTFAGGLASTLLKMHLWAPNASIIFGTQLNGQTGVAGSNGTALLVNTLNLTPYDYTQKAKEVCATLGVKVADIFGEAGISVWNSKEFITDGTHPYTTAGQLAIAKVFTEALKTYTKLS